MSSRIIEAQPWRASLPWPEGFAAGVAHRLDNATSGALVIADDPQELAAIRAAFRSGELTKTYRLWAGKDVPWDDNTCDRPIAHAPRRRRRMVVQRGARTPHRGRWYPAETAFRRLQGRVWEARMSTGVMHQIRVHAAFLGLPLAGDRLYGGGPMPPHGSQAAPFLLHHVGLEGAGLRTDPVPLPPWCRPVTSGGTSTR